MEYLSTWDVTLRLLAAIAAGAIVGWERETHGRPAGFRTTILACTAAALAMIISDALYATSSHELANIGGNWRPDPGRLGAGILTGMGFLGAGTIMRQEKFVKGVTTAATLWFVTVLGLAFGAGLFVVGALGLAAAILTLVLLPMIEGRIYSDSFATLRLTVSPDGVSDEELVATLKAEGAKPTKIAIGMELPSNERNLQFELKFKHKRRFELSSRVVRTLGGKPGVTRVAWE